MELYTELLAEAVVSDLPRNVAVLVPLLSAV